METLSAAIVYAWLTTHGGYHVPQATAITHYLEKESGFRPCIKVRTGSYLAQYVGPRKTSLQQFARTTDCPSWLVQMDFMDREIKGPFRAKLKGFFRAKTSAAAYYIFRRVFGQGLRS